MKKILYIYLLSFLMFGTSSCNEFLDIKPVDVLEGDIALVTFDDFNRALRGCYSGLTAGGYYGGTFFGLSDIPTDNVKRGQGNAGQWQFIYNLNYSSGSGEFEDFYVAAYQAIYRANLMLSKLDNMQGAPSQAAKDNIRAQALMIRALAHHDLVRTYAQRYDATADGSHLGITIKLEASLTFPPRNTVREVYNQIKADIETAYPLLTNTFALGATTFTQRAARALQARVAMYEKKWADAITFANEVTSTLSLATGTGYSGMWTDLGTGNGEVIFKLPMPVGFSRAGLTFYDRGADNDYYAPTTDLFNLYTDPTDIRRTSFFGASPNGGRRVITKYNGNAGNPGLADIKIFRISEMFLIRAEAKANTGDEAGALADLNSVRTARAASAGTETGTTLMTAIMTERRKEFPYEGHRWFDLVRTQSTMSRTDCNAVNCGLQPGNFRFTFPIPQQEIRSNPQTQQNPGY